MDQQSSSAVVARGRLRITLAALMWSTSGAFTKLLTRPEDAPTLARLLALPVIEPAQLGAFGLQIAFFRALFAGLALVPLLRPRDISFRPMMLPMAASFAVMNATFVSALALGTAANAILLQYTAPMWMFLASVWFLGERADLRSLAALVLGLAGVAVIVVGGWQEAQLFIVGIGLGSGLAYASVVVCLRVLKGASPRWLTVLNQLVSAAALVPWVATLPLPTPGQLVVLFLYGAVQMAIPYVLMARGLGSVSPQEAGTITLLEPLLNPLWAYLVSGEEPSRFTLVGGGFILAALAWRYWPRKRAF